MHSSGNLHMQYLINVSLHLCSTVVHNSVAVLFVNVPPLWDSPVACSQLAGLFAVGSGTLSEGLMQSSRSALPLQATGLLLPESPGLLVSTDSSVLISVLLLRMSGLGAQKPCLNKPILANSYEHWKLRTTDCFIGLMWALLLEVSLSETIEAGTHFLWCSSGSPRWWLVGRCVGQGLACVTHSWASLHLSVSDFDSFIFSLKDRDEESTDLQGCQQGPTREWPWESTNQSLP